MLVFQEMRDGSTNIRHDGNYVGTLECKITRHTKIDNNFTLTIDNKYVGNIWESDQVKVELLEEITE